MTVTMNVALLILRVVIGLTLAGHGVQKLFGWFGGPGLTKVRMGFDKQGLKPAWFWTGLAIVGEVGGGISFALVDVVGILISRNPSTTPTENVSKATPPTASVSKATS